MRAKYEEKTYEGYFNVELADRSDVYYPLGQVQEGGLGVDAVALTRSRWLWRRLGYPYWLRLRYKGQRLRAIAEEMELHLNEEIQNVPSIKSNVLFQYKRSDYLTSSNASEWSFWQQPYFRYDIYPEQQTILEHLHVKFGNSVLILYAAPALHDVNELVDYHINRKIIDNTNFRPAVDLTGHGRNTFADAGTHSIACSDPVRYERFDILEALLERRLTDQNNFESIVLLSKGVREALLGSPLRRAFSALIERYEIPESIASAPVLNAHIVMAALRELTGVQWVVSV